ncbi:ScbR family autoregulator-binding transcription factor [Streptomyces sp. NPDC001815]|uniref:ScbR family autoregulator-binding transcription factor n=1 Tax=Streptomyces sp. NPDC001815 TaxID=3154526 RepID=UPI0033227E15
MAQQDRALRTRAALIASAAEVFDQHGYPLASLATISSRAGVSNGALHFHFPSKASLADAVGTSAGHRLAKITGRNAGPLPGGSLQLLIDATHELVQGFGDDAVLRVGFRVARSVQASSPPAAGPRRHWKAWVEETLHQAAGEGTVAPGVPAQAVAGTVVATTLGLGALGGRNGAWRSPGTVTRLWELLLPGLVTGGVRGKLVTTGTTGTTGTTAGHR